MNSLQILDRLVQFDTTSHRSNLALVEFAEDWLSRHDVECKRLPDRSGSKAALVASIGPVDVAGVVLSGHTDTVPVDGQAWSSDPYRLRDGGDRVFGRGTCDMKGFVSVALAAVPMIRSKPLRRPIHLCLTYDEEVGCRGAGDAIAMLQGLACPPFGAILGEPTGMAPVMAHKGKLALRVRVTGREGHSAQPHQAVNALEIAAELVVFLRRCAERLRLEGGGAGYAPPWTTVHVGGVRGGVALNIVPGTAEIDFEIRHLPQHDPGKVVADLRSFAETELLPRMRAIEPTVGFSWETIAEYPALSEQAGSTIATLVAALVREPPAKVSFGTEAGLFQKAGIPAVVIGPGNIADAHRADESVSKAQLARCEAFLEGLSDALCV